MVGVPDKLVVIEVIFAANAVIECASTLSVFIVGVAELASLDTLGVTLLLVKVLVELMLGITTPSTAKTPAALLDIVVSEACPTAIVTGKQ